MLNKIGSTKWYDHYMALTRKGFPHLLWDDPKHRYLTTPCVSKDLPIELQKDNVPPETRLPGADKEPGDALLIYHSFHKVNFSGTKSILDVLQETESMFFMRHPFSRIASAYYYLYNEYQGYRERGVAANPPLYVSSKSHDFTTQYNAIQCTFRPQSVVEKALKRFTNPPTESMRGLWRPQHETCPVCSMNFTIMGRSVFYEKGFIISTHYINKDNFLKRFESMDEDLVYFYLKNKPKRYVESNIL